MKRFFLSTALLLPCIAIACGSLASDPDRPSVLGSIQGQIQNPESVSLTSDTFRVAVVWSVSRRGSEGRQWLQSAQEAPVTPVFPAKFRLDLTAPPPEEAMGEDPEDAPGMRIANGSIIAYQDVNHNERLDLVDPRATSYVDRVIAVGAEFTIRYLEGDPARLVDVEYNSGARPVLGFNLYFGNTICHLYPDGGGSCTSGGGWKSIDTPITLVLSAEPKLSQKMCRLIPGNTDPGSKPVRQHPAGEFPRTFPSKGSLDVKCLESGRSYIQPGCTEVTEGLCRYKENMLCELHQYSLVPGSQPPSGWPCDVSSM